MVSTSVTLPEGLKKQLDERLGREDYQNVSEYIREALREKLRRETRLSYEEMDRIMRIREKDKNGKQEWISKDEMLERLEIDEADLSS